MVSMTGHQSTVCCTVHPEALHELMDLADNYALFALSKYLAPRIRGKFAFLPEVAEKGFGYNELAVPFSGDDGASILLSEFFSQRTQSQPNYNASQLQPDKSIHIENLLRPDQKADITRMPYVKNMPDSPGTQKNLQSFKAFGEAYKDQLVNRDANYDLTCFGKDSDKHPYAKDFDGNKAVEFAGQFCEDIIKTWDVATPVPPTVRDTSDFRNASRVYSLKGTDPESHLGFFAVADPALYIQPRNIRQFFEGATDEAKIDHCRLTYKDIIRNVRYQSHFECIVVQLLTTPVRHGCHQETWWCTKTERPPLRCLYHSG